MRICILTLYSSVTNHSEREQCQVEVGVVYFQFHSARRDSGATVEAITLQPEIAGDAREFPIAPYGLCNAAV